MACVYLLQDCNGFGYIGSTIDLRKRLTHHNSKRNDCKSKCLTKPFECYVLEQIEDDDNLYFAERFYIKLYKDLYGDKLVNTIIPLRTRKEYNNEYKDKIKIYRREYRINNREKINIYKREYRINNIENTLELRKKSYYRNKEKILQKNKIQNSTKINCECGSIYGLLCKTNHLKSKRHLDFVNG